MMDHRASKVSGGERKMVPMGRALTNKPEDQFSTNRLSDCPLGFQHSSWRLR